MGNSYFPTDPWVCCQAGLLCLDSVSTCSSTCHHVITGDDQTLRFIIFAQLCRPAGWTCFVSSCSLSAYVTDKPRHSGLSAGCITARSHKSWCIKREKKTAYCRRADRQTTGVWMHAGACASLFCCTCGSVWWHREKNSMDAWIFHLFSDPEINLNQI